MNQLHVVKSASKAVLRAMNALDDLQTYMRQLNGQVVPQGLAATTGKVVHARELVQEIDAALTDRSLTFLTKSSAQNGQSVHPSSDSK